MKKGCSDSREVARPSFTSHSFLVACGLGMLGVGFPGGVSVNVLSCFGPLSVLSWWALCTLCIVEVSCSFWQHLPIRYVFMSVVPDSGLHPHTLDSIHCRAVSLLISYSFHGSWLKHHHAQDHLGLVLCFNS